MKKNVYITESLCCTAEINTFVNQPHFNIFLKNEVIFNTQGLWISKHRVSLGVKGCSL